MDNVEKYELRWGWLFWQLISFNQLFENNRFGLK